jgi:small subunit ribosomal protein S1
MSGKDLSPRIRTIRRQKKGEERAAPADLPTGSDASQETAKSPVRAAKAPAPAAEAPAQAVEPEAAPIVPEPEPEPEPVLRLDAKALEEEIADLGPDAMAKLMAEAPPAEPEPGSQVEGRVARVATHGVFVDIGAKSEAVMDRSDFKDPDAVKVGDTVKAYVLSADHRGIKLAHQLSGAGAREMLAEAHAAGIPVQGRVESRNPGGFTIKLSGTSAFCPISQIARIPSDDLDSYLGQTLSFKISEYKGRDLVVSRRAIEDEEAAEEAAKTWGLLKPGDERDGIVSGIQDFGIFVDIGGLQGLVHKSELGWDDGEEPPARGAKVQVKVISVDPDKERLSLTMKVAGSGPWARMGTEFVVGGTYEGTVTKLAEFGAFVKLAAGLEGLVHISEMADHRVDHPRSVAKKGQTVKVRILEIDRERDRIGLSMKDGEDSSWRENASKSSGKGESMGTLADLLGGLKLD